MNSKMTIVTLSGVIAGMLVGGVLMGRAGAQYGQPMPQPAASARYQYKCLTKMQERIWAPEAQNMLNAEGAQGWRLMDNRPIWPNGYSDVYCFERRY